MAEAASGAISIGANSKSEYRSGFGLKTELVASIQFAQPRILEIRGLDLFRFSDFVLRFCAVRRRTFRSVISMDELFG